MKPIFMLVAAMLPLFAFVACEKNSAEDVTVREETVNAERYYVRYVISSDAMNEATIRYTTEKGEQEASFTSKKEYLDETFGPVEKGFESFVSVTTEDSYPVVSVKIYVSVGSEPFVLKASSSSKKSTHATYVIDF